MPDPGGGRPAPRCRPTAQGHGAGPMSEEEKAWNDKVIGGKTLQQRRDERDTVRRYDPKKLKVSVARAIKEAKNKEEYQETKLQERRQKRADLNDLNAPLWKIWSYLKPDFRVLFSKDWKKFGMRRVRALFRNTASELCRLHYHRAEWEALGMLAICFVRLIEFRMQTDVIRILDGTLNSRNFVRLLRC
eukprot:SAG31_NODE_1639_length_7669_cov_13.434082_2_plen_189_part_00